jgi:hypothetical protein
LCLFLSVICWLSALVLTSPRRQCQKSLPRVCSPLHSKAKIVTFTVKAHHERYLAVFAHKTMDDALAKANELVAAGYNAVTIQDENGYLYLESDFVLLGQKPTTEQ